MAEGITTVTSKYQVTIPRRVRRLMGIKKGDRVAFVPSERGVLLVPADELLTWLARTLQGIEETIAESRAGFRPRR
ncbi:MAG: AbrB/MazE/SpoVT family DNA-binding domain-containing protein [Euryarchaeota archaeon]|nr:AbrB/MazE/SpoVT family DNA-binding domain-containing protein [Euryarchaeota archaeon]